MPVPQRRFHGDEELGKKDDDHKIKPSGPMGRAWQQRRLPIGPRRSNLKKIALGILVVLGFYYFFKNMPTDLQQPRQRPSYQSPAGPNAPASRAPPRPKEIDEDVSKTPVRNYNGRISFYELGPTLHAIKTQGSSKINENVLFAAASLKSAATLLPIACDMSIQARNHVHFALAGRDDISMDILKSVNGIGNECSITFHDARPDYAAHSTDWRMEISSGAAFGHINTFLNPQASFVDSSGEEEVWFLKGVKERAGSLDRTIIELPEDAVQTMMWTTLLDSSSLSAWNKVSLDFIVHAQPSASGSLIRLLESLKKANFFNSRYPSLTIELPHDTDEPTKRYLERFNWPPKGDQTGSLLKLQHRIPQHDISAEESSARFLESFWPANPSASHVLVLSPQIELSPHFFHYLKWIMLEFKYSSNNPAVQNLLSISLDLPSTYLNDTTKFSRPQSNPTGNTTHFLWQAPNSNAALYFGEKWVELHDFVSHSLESQRTLSTPTTLNEKQVSKTYPSWMEHVLRFAQARGYWTLYPSFEDEDRVVTLHNDLYSPPEEYSSEVKETLDDSTELGADPAKHLSLKHKETSLITTSLLNILPLAGDLPKIWEMPLLTWDGERVEVEEFFQRATNYSAVFRREIGGCTEDNEDEEEKVRVESMAGDLFCLKV